MARSAIADLLMTPTLMPPWPLKNQNLVWPEVEDLVERTRKPCEEALKMAGMTPDLLKHPVYGDPEGPQYPKVVEFMEKSKGLAEVLREHGAEIVFTPYFEDAHPDHRATTRIVEDARFDAKLPD